MEFKRKVFIDNRDPRHSKWGNIGETVQRREQQNHMFCLIRIDKSLMSSKDACGKGDGRNAQVHPRWRAPKPYAEINFTAVVSLTPPTLQWRKPPQTENSKSGRHRLTPPIETRRVKKILFIKIGGAETGVRGTPTPCSNSCRHLFPSLSLPPPLSLHLLWNGTTVFPADGQPIGSRIFSLAPPTGKWILQ